MTIKNKFSKILQTLRHEMHSNHSRKTFKSYNSHRMHSNLRCMISSAPKPKIPKITRPTAFSNMTLSVSQPQNFQHSQSQTFDVPDRYSEQIRLHREWEEKMERLNKKYGLDCFSNSELDSKSDEGEDYRYEHKYETLI